MNRENLASRILTLISGGLGIIAGLCFLVSGLQAVLQGGITVDEVVSACGSLAFGVAFFIGGTVLLFSFFRKKYTLFPYILPIIVLAGEAIIWLIHFILLNVAGADGLGSARNTLIFLVVFGFAGIFFLVFSLMQKESKLKTVLLLIGIAISFAALLRGFPYYFGADGAGEFFSAQVFIGLFVAELLTMVVRKKEEKPREIPAESETKEEK